MHGWCDGVWGGQCSPLEPARRSWNGGLAAITVALGTGLIWGSGEPAQGQIVPDGTLGAERSQVNADAIIRGLPGILINGGATRGSNLFQSFADFNVQDGQRVYFANPAGVNSILTRVTGLNPSQIFGTLGVDGAANLFLLNPRGIVFGPNARLDIAGSFVASSSEAFEFGNGLSFSAVDPHAAPLMAVTLTPGLQVGSRFTGPVTNAGQLAVGAGQTLSLAGQEVTNAGSLTASGGTVQVLGDRLFLQDTSRIDVSAVGGGGNVFVGGNFQGRGPLPNAQQVTVRAGAQIEASALGMGNGGQVVTWADGATVFAGQVRSRGGSQSGNGGLVEVSGKETLQFTGQVDTLAPFGISGTLLLDPKDIRIVAGPADGVNTISSQVLSATTSNISLLADNTITFDAPISITTQNVGITAEAGQQITVNQNILTQNGDVVLRSPQGRILITNGACIGTNGVCGGQTSSFTPVGRSGDIRLFGGDRVDIINGSLDARSDTGSSDPVFATVVVNGGSVRLDNAYVSATNLGEGLAGDIFITGTNTVEILNSSNQTTPFKGINSRGRIGRILIGGTPINPALPTPVSIRIANSSIANDNNTPGSGEMNVGDVVVRAQQSIDLEGVDIQSGTFREGNSGDIRLITTGSGGQIQISDRSLIRNNVSPSGQGNSGVIIVRTNDLKVSGFSQIQSLTQGVGDAGGVRLDAGSGDIVFDQADVLVNVEAGAQGDAGILLVFADDVTLKNGSQFQTIVRGSEDGVPGGVGNAGGIGVFLGGDLNIDGSLKGSDGRIFPSWLSSDVGRGAQGDAGAIVVKAQGIYLTDRGQIRVNNFSDAGLAGDIDLTTDFLVLDRRGKILALSRSGQGGNIEIASRHLVGVSRNSNIAADSGGATTAGNGGNISIGNGRGGRTLMVYGFPLNDSNILAEANGGNGGTIFIESRVLRNLQSSDGDRPDRNDISTKSRFGVSGTVNASGLATSFENGLNPLTERIEDPRVSQGCDPRTRRENISLVSKGKDGLSQNPTQVLITTEGFAEPIALGPEAVPLSQAASPTTATASPPDPPIRIAQAMVVDAQGNARFVDAGVPVPALTSPALSCTTPSAPQASARPEVQP